MNPNEAYKIWEHFDNYSKDREKHRNLIEKYTLNNLKEARAFIRKSYSNTAVEKGTFHFVFILLSIISYSINLYIFKN